MSLHEPVRCQPGHVCCETDRQTGVTPAPCAPGGRNLRVCECGRGGGQVVWFDYRSEWLSSPATANGTCNNCGCLALISTLLPLGHFASKATAPPWPAQAHRSALSQSAKEKLDGQSALFGKPLLGVLGCIATTCMLTAASGRWAGASMWRGGVDWRASPGGVRARG